MSDLDERVARAKALPARSPEWFEDQNTIEELRADAVRNVKVYIHSQWESLQAQRREDERVKRDKEWRRWESEREAWNVRQEYETERVEGPFVYGAPKRGPRFFVAFVGEYESRSPVGVFTDLGKAKEASLRGNGADRNEYSIDVEEWEVTG